LIPVTQERQIPQDPFLSRRFLRLRKQSDGSSAAQGASRHYYFSWARNAIYHSLRVGGLVPGDAVLVPSYVCKVVPEAIRGYGADVLYYRIDRNCLPDLSDLAGRVGGRTRALLAVHYFGFPQPVAELREFCNLHGLYFIEDCAHVLRSQVNGKPLGTFGDASVFSLRKFFPMYDGAELLLNRPYDELNIECASESPLYTLKTLKDAADQIAAHSLNAAIRVPFEFLMSSAKRLFATLKAQPGSRALAAEKTDATFDAQLVNLPMSRWSSMLYLRFDTPEIVKQRRVNYEFLRRELASLPGVRFFGELPETVCPWVLPVFLSEQPDACQALRAEQLPAANWEGVRPTDLPQGAYPDADFLYRHLIFLPVHQDLAIEDLQRIVQAVTRVSKSEAPIPEAANARSARFPVGSTEILRQGSSQS
jgi:perosamine synthetase